MIRNRRLDIRLSAEERRALEILSVREGRILSELARELLLSAIETRGVQVVSLINLLYPEGKNEQRSRFK
jgi:hypothetical protein